MRALLARGEGEREGKNKRGGRRKSRGKTCAGPDKLANSRERDYNFLLAELIALQGGEKQSCPLPPPPPGSPGSPRLLCFAC